MFWCPERLPFSPIPAVRNPTNNEASSAEFKFQTFGVLTVDFLSQFFGDVNLCQPDQRAWSFDRLVRQEIWHCRYFLLHFSSSRAPQLFQVKIWKWEENWAFISCWQTRISNELGSRCLLVKLSTSWTCQRLEISSQWKVWKAQQSFSSRSHNLSPELLYQAPIGTSSTLELLSTSDVVETELFMLMLQPFPSFKLSCISDGKHLKFRQREVFIHGPPFLLPANPWKMWF